MARAKTGAQFSQPPWTENYRGDPRQLGVELEMAGIRPEVLAECVKAELGGEIERDSAFLTQVKNTELGDFSIELDADVLLNRGYQEHLAELGIDIGQGQTRDQIESVLSRVAGLVVPLELVAPPVPWRELPRLDAIRQRLHSAGAQGTGSSAFYAFGYQLNIEVPSRRIEELLAMFRAFLLKYEWLKERSELDFARRLSPYVQPYPEDWCAHVLAPDYRPTLEQFMDDFLSFTPTRNRPLDLLPLLAWLDEARVMAAPVEKDLIKPRPALHYRLPNCLIDEPEWCLFDAWNDWVEVERLAADEQALEKALEQRLAQPRRFRLWLSTLWRQLRS